MCAIHISVYASNIALDRHRPLMKGAVLPVPPLCLLLRSPFDPNARTVPCCKQCCATNLCDALECALWSHCCKGHASTNAAHFAQYAPCLVLFPTSVMRVSSTTLQNRSGSVHSSARPKAHTPCRLLVLRHGRDAWLYGWACGASLPRKQLAQAACCSAKRCSTWLG